jgi:hypothetical protein
MVGFCRGHFLAFQDQLDGLHVKDKTEADSCRTASRNLKWTRGPLLQHFTGVRALLGPGSSNGPPFDQLDGLHASDSLNVRSPAIGTARGIGWVSSMGQTVSELSTCWALAGASIWPRESAQPFAGKVHDDVCSIWFPHSDRRAESGVCKELKQLLSMPGSEKGFEYSSLLQGISFPALQ